MQDVKIEESCDREDRSCDPPDGLWITNPPFILPSGIKHCPSPTCPAHSRTFRPYWRLNEHMKLRHGWPRKQTQPHLDKRLGNRFGGRRTKKSRQLIQSSDDEASGDEHERNSMSSLEPVLVQGNTLLRPRYFQVASSELRPSPDRFTLEETRYSHDPFNNVSSSMHRLVNIPDSSMSDETELIITPNSGLRTAASSSRDDTMIAEFEKYIRELEQDISRNTMSVASPDLTESRKEMVAGLKSILHKSLARINTVVPAHQARAISPYYRALAIRASFASSGQRSVLASTSPVARSLQQPLLPMQRFSTPSSRPKPDGAAQPRPKLKLILKMTPTQNLQNKSTVST